jgi:hypothetical protein
LRESGYRFERTDRAEIMRVMIRIAAHKYPDGEEIDAIARWVKGKIVKLE